MTPPHIHMHVETAVSAGTFPTNTVGDPGTHGVAVTGMQGMGVKTPIAEAVAAATVGLEGVIHIPKGGIFTMGLKSIIVATGLFSAITILWGRTSSVEGATPNEQVMVALRVTSWGIPYLLSFPYTILPTELIIDVWFFILIPYLVTILKYLSEYSPHQALPFLK